MTDRELAKSMDTLFPHPRTWRECPGSDCEQQVRAGEDESGSR